MSGKIDQAMALGEALVWTEADLAKRHPSILERRGTIAVMIDLQEKLVGAMIRRYDILARASFLIEAMRLLGIPLLVTEQYPKGLGPTDRRLAGLLDEALFFEKLSFSAICDERFVAWIEEHRPTRVLLFGVETHVCVAQTALDLVARGIGVTIAADAVASRRDEDHRIALERLRTSGVVIGTAESAVFELLREAGTPEFKSVLKLVR
jgi:nicotinamidase-related amidase